MTTYTFSDITNITPSAYPAVLTSSATGTSAQWSLQYPHADGNYPDFEWDEANATNATLGWAVVGTGNGSISYNASTGMIDYYVNSSWTHSFLPTEGRSSSGGSGPGTLSVTPGIGATTTGIIGSRRRPRSNFW